MDEYWTQTAEFIPQWYRDADTTIVDHGIDITFQTNNPNRPILLHISDWRHFIHEGRHGFISVTNPRKTDKFSHASRFIMDHAAVIWTSDESPVPHSIDHRPAIVVFSNIRWGYNRDGLLDSYAAGRRRPTPAITTSYAGAAWMDHGKLHRPNGPHKVFLWGLESRYNRGLYEFGFDDIGYIEAEWGHHSSFDSYRLGDCRLNRYFNDIQDEVLYMLGRVYD